MCSYCSSCDCYVMLLLNFLIPNQCIEKDFLKHQLVTFTVTKKNKTEDVVNPLVIEAILKQLSKMKLKIKLRLIHQL